MKKVLISKKSSHFVSQFLLDHRAKMASDPVYRKEWNNNLDEAIRRVNRIAEQRRFDAHISDTLRKAPIDC